MEQIKIPMENGYNLIAVVDNDADDQKVIHVGTTDNEDVWNQELVAVVAKNEDHGDVFYAQLFLDPNAEDFAVQYPIGLHRDPVTDGEEILDEDEVADDPNGYDYDNEEDIADDGGEPEPAIPTLSYGMHGEAVKTIQARLKDLGYFDGSVLGNYLTKTKAAVEAFQTAAGLHVDGICDAATLNRLMSNDAPREEHPATEIAGTQDHAIPMDWWKSDIQSIFSKGTVATITDVETRLSWKEKRRGGTNHADVMPLTASDTANLKKAYGGKWKWDRRAIWVTINGVTYAASMNGMPHGNTSIKDNNFDGHHCIHFTNSRTHCSDKVCPKHQAAIKKAASVKLA